MIFAAGRTGEKGIKNMERNKNRRSVDTRTKLNLE